jgi:hypothetical protein
MTLDEALDGIKSLKLDLRNHRDEADEGDPHRPELRVSAMEDDGIPNVTLTVSATWGQQLRFVTLMPDEARRLARQLTMIADAVDAVTAGMPKCETCGSAGKIDQRLGGIATSSTVPCPDCKP